MLYRNKFGGKNGRLKPPVKCPGKPGARFDRIESDRRSRPFYVKQHLVDPRFAPVGSCPEQFRLIRNRGTALSLCFKALYCAEPLRTFAGNAPDGLGLTRFQAKGRSLFRFRFVSAGLSIVAARHICSRVLNAQASSEGRRLRLLFRQAGFQGICQIADKLRVEIRPVLQFRP